MDVERDRRSDSESEGDGPSGKRLRVAGVTLLAAAAAGAIAALIVRDQMSRHSRDLFSPRSLKRLAALGYMAREPATVNNITLLRDFIAWEPRRLLRNRAEAILARMEREARGRELTVADRAS